MKQELERKAKAVTNAFGGGDKLIATVAASLDLPINSIEVIYELTKFLYHPDIIVMVAPWSYIFSIVTYTDAGSLDELSCISDEPYSVYSTDGRLLYSVSNHLGIFGNSVLDRALMAEADPGSIFYLQFPTYKGYRRTILLIVNRESPVKILDNPYFKPGESRTKQDALNYINLDASTSNRNTSQLGNPIYPITYYYKVANPGYIVNIDDVIQDHTNVITFNLDLEDYIHIYPKESQWAVFTQFNGDSTDILKVIDISGDSSRFIDMGGGLYYIAASVDTDINLVRQSLGLVNVLPPNPSQISSINMKGSLTP